MCGYFLIKLIFSGCHTRVAGIGLDLVTGDLVIAENMETSIPGIFAAGNVVHVNDLVYNVSLRRGGPVAVMQILR